MRNDSALSFGCMILEQICSDEKPSQKEKGAQTMNSLSYLIGTFISCIVVKDVVTYICNPGVLFGSR